VLIICVVSGIAGAGELLVEAESFKVKGGWVVDQQFVDTMGSPYLLAHGMGKAVKNAGTKVQFPAAGKYRLWVRTKDWVPGDWEPPGRFKVLINGEAVETVFGTEEGWAWQDGGKVDLTCGETTLELQDLTGFEGRCDALFFTTDMDFKPPNKLKELGPWRDRLTKAPETPKSAGKFDLVIVGGGISGCAAALAADEEGLKTALIHDRPVLGGNASAEVRVHTLGIYGRGADIIKKIDTRHWKNGSAEAEKDDKKRTLFMDKAENVKQFLSWRAYASNMDDNKIASVDARHIETGETLRFEAPFFVDCTGDGWIGFWAGAEFRVGRESRDEFKEGVDKWGEIWSPKKPDMVTMGNSVLWNSKKTDKPVSFPAVPWAQDVAKGHASINGEWYWEYAGKDTIYDAEEIRDHMFRAIYGSFANAKKNPKNANVALKWVAYLAGKRESRRLLGDYIFTMQDAVQNRKFKDAVVEEKREIDVHYQRRLKGDKLDFLSKALFYKTGMYYIPFRCLYSRNVPNLMMAGRCFSCSHIGLGGPRVMRTCGQMGIATGKAAALCLKHKIMPRDIYPDDEKIAELQKMIGGRIPAAGGGIKKPESMIAVVDNKAAELKGKWKSSSVECGYQGSDYLHDDNANKGECSVTFRLDVPEKGRYEVLLTWRASPSRASRVPVDVIHAGGKKTVYVNQKQDSAWFSLGAYEFEKGKKAEVVVRTDGTRGHVIADAAGLAKAKER
jgi:hypothetical protein